jgi:hypothetical protein
MKSKLVFENYLTDALKTAASVRYSCSLVASPSTQQPGDAEADQSNVISQAIILRRLKMQYQTTGFLALPLDQYLSRLARLSDVVLPIDVTASRRGHSLSRLKPWLSLARKLDVATEHVRLLVRAWFATEFLGAQAVGTVVARGYRTSRSRQGQRLGLSIEETASPQLAETELQHVEGHYSPSLRHELATALRNIV